MSNGFDPRHLVDPVFGEAHEVRFAIGEVADDDDIVAVSFDVSGRGEMYLDSVCLREIADQIDRIASEGDES